MLLQGAFDQQLWKTLGRAKNVILVWTKGCMDRFLDNEDPTNQGLKRKRIMQFVASLQPTMSLQILCVKNTFLLSNKKRTLYQWHTKNSIGQIPPACPRTARES